MNTYMKLVTGLSLLGIAVLFVHTVWSAYNCHKKQDDED